MDLLSLESFRRQENATKIDQVAPVKRLLFVLLCLLWLVPGLYGRDLWKPHELHAIIFIQDVAENGARMLLEPWGGQVLNIPPMYYWISGTLASALPASWGEIHEHARLANILLIVLVLAATAASAGTRGERTGWISVLLLVGSLGLIIQSHTLNSNIGAMVGTAVQMLGFSLMLRRSFFGGMLVGTGTGLGFMMHGFNSISIAIATAVILPLVHDKWRSYRYLGEIATGIVFAIPWLVAWPAALLHSGQDEAFDLWLQSSRGYWPNIGVPNGEAFLQYVKEFSWSAWPVWPIAVYAFCRGISKRSQLLPDEVLYLVLFVVASVLFVLATEHRETDVFMALPPLAAMAAISLKRLPYGASSALDWFALLMLGLAGIALLWISWIALTWGYPQALAEWLRSFRPGVEISSGVASVLISVVVTAGWIALILNFGRSFDRAVLNWACGIVTTWLLFCLLWLQYVDVGKSYRGVSADLSKNWPQQPQACVRSDGISNQTLFQFHYFEGLNFSDSTECQWALMPEELGEEWVTLWEGGRPGDSRERFFLQKRREQNEPNL